MIKAYEIGVSIVVGDSASKGVTALGKDFERLQGIINDTQIKANNLVATMRGMGRVGASVAAEWRGVAKAMEQAAVAARGASAGMGSGAAAAASAAGASAGGRGPVPVPLRIAGPAGSGGAVVPSPLRIAGPAIIDQSGRVWNGGAGGGSGGSPRAGAGGAINFNRIALENGMMAYFGWDAIKGIAEPTIEINDQIANMRAQVLFGGNTADGRDKVNAIVAQAYDQTSAVPGSGWAKNTELSNRISSITGDVDETLRLAPDLIRDSRVLGLTGSGDPLAAIENAVRAGELAGLTKRDASGHVVKGADGKDAIDFDKLTSLINGWTSASVALGGGFDIGGMLTAIRQFGSGASTASLEFLTTKLPVYAKVMGSARSGTASASEQQSMLSEGGRNGGNKKIIAEQMRLGIRGASGELSPEDKELIQKDLNTYLITRILPILNANGYNTPSQIQAELAKIVPRQTMARLNSTTFSDMSLFDKDFDVIGKQIAAGVGPLLELLRNSPTNQVAAFTEALHLFEAELGSAALGPATDALRWLTRELHGLADWARDNPDGAKAALEGFAGGVALFGASAAAGIAMSVLTNPVTGLIALAGGIEALGGAFKILPQWIIDAAAGAMVGGRVGGMPGALIGAGVGAGARPAISKGTELWEDLYYQDWNPTHKEFWFGNKNQPSFNNMHQQLGLVKDANGNWVKPPDGTSAGDYLRNASQAPTTSAAPPPPPAKADVTINTQVNLDGQKVAESTLRQLGLMGSGPSTGGTDFNARTSPDMPGAGVQ